MALLFDANTELVNHGSASTVDDIQAGTIIFWHNPSSLAARGHIFRKSGTHLWRLTQETSGFHEFGAAQPTGGITIVNSASAASVNTWNYVAVTWDTAGAAADQEIWLGNLTTIAAESASYTTQTVGTGTHDNASATLYVGSRGDTTAPYTGRIALCALYTKRLNLGQIRAQQWNIMKPVTDSCVMFVNYGFNGTSTQADWSGNGNSGSVTGATVYPHVPIGMKGHDGFRGLPGTSGHPSPAPGLPLGRGLAPRPTPAAGVAPLSINISPDNLDSYAQGVKIYNP